MSEKMREEFETEFRKHPKFEGNAIYADAMLERGSDGNYRFTIAEGAWWGWQASRESLVIELPSEDDTRCDTVAEIAKQEAYNLALGECASAIEAAGLKVKP